MWVSFWGREAVVRCLVKLGMNMNLANKVKILILFYHN